jgi:transcriptional regulator GlxA family with amidase domain
VFNHRPGGQAQFSQTITVPAAPTDSIRALVADLPTLLDRDCSVAVLAGRAAMSNRTFARRFRAETGRTPAEHVELLRVEAAKSRLQSSEESLSSVARTCGFGTVETMHRAFRRRVATTPDLYRRHFRRISYVH